MDALFYYGCYELDVQHLENAREIFTRCIRLTPRAEFFLKRGHALRLLRQDYLSLADYSQCIHLDPGRPYDLMSILDTYNFKCSSDNWQAFFYRGCMLSVAEPQQALRDLSVSLLIEDGVANINAYLHRSKLYLSQSQYKDALPDLQRVLDLNTTLVGSRTNVVYAVVASCQMGLIHMQYFRNLGAAIRSFLKRERGGGGGGGFFLVFF